MLGTVLYRRFAGVAFACALLASSGILHASPVTPSFPPQFELLVGDNVEFSIDIAQEGIIKLYGTPTRPIVAGDSLFFPAGQFRVDSLNGAGVVNNVSNIVFDVVIKQGGGPSSKLSSVTIAEGGDYFITPGSGGSVSAQAQLGAFDTSIGIFSFIQSLVETGTLTDPGLNPWGLNTSLDFMTGWSQASTAATVNLQNNLSATSIVANSESWIQKKFSGIEISVGVVPLPGTAVLLLSSLFGLGAARRFSRPRG